MNSALDGHCFWTELARRYRIVFALTWQDLRNRYVGATFGLFWSFIQPLIMALILWFVFAVAMGAQPRHGVPFIAWFLVSVAAYNVFCRIAEHSHAGLPGIRIPGQKHQVPD